jgi:hypothetical protein
MLFMPDVISQSNQPEKMSGTKTVPDLPGYGQAKSHPPKPFVFSAIFPSCPRAFV